MKIMRGKMLCANFKGPEAISQNGDDVVSVLQSAFNEKKRVVDKNIFVFLENWRFDNNVGNPCFIFEAQKKKSFGR